VEALLAYRRSRYARTTQQTIHAWVRKLRKALHPALEVFLEHHLAGIEQDVNVAVHGDARRHLATLVLTRAAEACWNVTPMTLLALAVAVGCEPPVSSESRQVALYNAWKQRHSAAWKKAKRAAQVAQLAEAMSTPRLWFAPNLAEALGQPRLSRGTLGGKADAGPATDAEATSMFVQALAKRNG
jgi:hypothetical protein